MSQLRQRFAMHAKLQNGPMYVYDIIDVGGNIVGAKSEHLDRRARKTVTTYKLADRDTIYHNLEAFVCAYEGKTPMKISLQSQIAEVDRELAQRRQVYPRLVSARQMRESMAQLQMSHLEAVRATLVWLRENELLIKQRLAQ